MTENVYEGWSEYRKQTTEYIINACREGGSIALFGAGRCADLDLKALAEHFKKIVLFDRDIEAVNEAVKYYEVSVSPDGMGKIGNTEVLFSKIDFAGITGEDFAKTSDYYSRNIVNAIKAGRYSEFEEGMYQLIESIYGEKKNYRPVFDKLKVDYGVILGTHSQLNNNFSAQWYVLRSYIETSLFNKQQTGNVEKEAFLSQWFDRITGNIEKIQRSHTQQLVVKLNDSILDMVEKKLVVGLETGNTGVPDSIIDGAYNAILDFEERYSSGEIKIDSKISLVWPFDISRRISYDILLMNCEKIND